ncbi:MAG: DsbA family protein [Chromatiales bacterium]|nr:DsbA family protein [Chromatiales bacterium]
MKVLYYIHDPMCSWCYAFAPAWQALCESLPPAIEIRRLLGGLAADDDLPMDAALRQHLMDTWRRIEARVPGTRFNFDFWRNNTPRRSTWIACRAVIAARRQDVQHDLTMTAAIAHAYYREARNPSDEQTLIDLASEIGIDNVRFTVDLRSAGTQAALASEMGRAKSMGAHGFPSLILDLDGTRWPVAVDYRDPRTMLETIDTLVAG